jgi:hypothetical protein
MSIDFINAKELPALLLTLVDSGFKVYYLDCFNVVDSQSFFKAAIISLPMGDAELNSDTKWRFPSNWNAFDDFLWQGITEEKDEKVAIILTNTAQMSDLDSMLLGEIIRSFAQLANMVNAEDTFNSVPAILLLTYVVTT